MRIVGVAFILFILTGCIPRYATTRPHLEVDVRDPQGEPIPTAVMQLVTFTSHGLPSEEKFVADEQGHIAVARKSEWSPLVFFIHGMVFYHWQWCINAPGFSAAKGTPQTLDKPIILQRSASPTICNEFAK